MSGDANPDAGGPVRAWTLWSASRAWTRAMRGLIEMPDVGDGPEILAAFGLAAYAEAEGIAAVASPQDLADLSLNALYARMDPVRFLVDLSTAQPGSPAAPAVGDPEHEQFAQWRSELDAANAGGAQALLADPQRLAQAETVADDWLRRSKNAQMLVARTIMVSAREEADLDAEGEARLRLLADRVPGHVALDLDALLRAPRPEPADTDGPEAEFARAQERAKELTVTAGHTECWPAGAARALLSLLLLAAARDRGETVAEVPWSAVRARTLLGGAPDGLQDYLDARSDDFADEAVRALRFLRERHFYQGWISSDGLSSDPGLDRVPRLSHGWPLAVHSLDRQLLADRGGFAIGTAVSTTATVGAALKTGVVQAASWEIAARADQIGAVDLAPGVPRAYQLQYRFGETERVLAGKCTRAAGN
ncbi:hypothetical protein [Amycolatopsis sp. NPDC004079]|uniref:hypothetical protein n=1 Tax=Amycolatopsis sp. NPDC004079 TaxID=3154549 RepID=UPI0033AACFEA